MLLSVGQKYSPIILLGLRASLKEDILWTPAELVFGTTIRLPGEMFDSSKPDDDVVNFVSKLKSHMHNHFTLNHQNTIANVQFLSIQDCWKQHMFFFAETCYVVHFNNPMMALSKCKPAFFLNTEDFQLPQTKNETPATVEPNATASTPATVESDPTASTPTQPSTRSGRKVHLPTRMPDHATRQDKGEGVTKLATEFNVGKASVGDINEWMEEDGETAEFLTDDDIAAAVT
ncbi:hypothetical protein TNCV_4303721 [Trichonephila clavipes]|nr:hypothetical protein TNCV_4303721 [Trichonephila clavipes]